MRVQKMKTGRRLIMKREFLKMRKRRRIEKLSQMFPTKGCEEEEDNEEGYEEVENVGVSEEQKDESEDEEEEEGETHSRLLSAISDLDHQRKRGQRSEATPTVSQFQLSTDGEEVEVGGLLRGVENTATDVATLRRQLATPSSHQLSPLATSGQVEKAHRDLAYSAACSEVGKWLPLVTHNRKATHLSLPLQEEAVTELEKAVEGVLGRSAAVVEATDEELTAAERVELVRVMGEEGRERVKESRRWRMLMSQYEAKCQREKRIKSRRFHKVQRRRHDKAKEGERGEGEEGEGEGEGEKAERLRARERMTLRHSRQGKWAREVLARKRKDPAARAALSEHSQRGQALTHHLPPADSEEEEEEEESIHSEEEEKDKSPPISHHDNPWLHPSFTGKPRELAEQETNFEPSQLLIENDKPPSDEELATPSQSDDITSCQSTTATSLKTSRPSLVPVIDPTAYLTSRDEVGGALGVASQQLLNIHEAFAGDDVVGEWEKEKSEREEAGREEIQLELPGWGSWGGEGVKAKRKKIENPQTAMKPRSDREPGHVIIGDHGNGKLNKHLVKKLPWPYSNPQQFTRAQATPIGRHWNSEVVHRQMVTPRVETAVGVAISPIKLTDDVQEFMKNQDARRTRTVQSRKSRSLHNRKIRSTHNKTNN